MAKGSGSQGRQDSFGIKADEKWLLEHGGSNNAKLGTRYVQKIAGINDLLETKNRV